MKCFGRKAFFDPKLLQNPSFDLSKLITFQAINGVVRSKWLPYHGNK